MLDTLLTASLLPACLPDVAVAVAAAAASIAVAAPSLLPQVHSFMDSITAPTLYLSAGMKIM